MELKPETETKTETDKKVLQSDSNGGENDSSPQQLIPSRAGITQRINTATQRISLFFHQFRWFIIAHEEFIDTVKSRKYRFFLLALLIPFLIALATLPPGSDTGVKVSVKAFEEGVGEFIGSYWAAWPGQILAILLAAEFIAGEYENETLRLLLVKPLHRYEILLGKFIAFLATLTLAIFAALFVYDGVVIMRHGGGKSGLWKSLPALFGGLFIVMLVLLTVAIITAFFSTISTKSLHAALFSIILTLFYTLILAIITSKEPDKFALQYQAGVIYSEFFRTSGTTFTGDYKNALIAFGIVNIIALIATLIALNRKEIP